MRSTRFTCYKNAEYKAFLNFVSEKFAMTISLKDCTLLIKLFYKNNECAQVALQKFWTLKGKKKGLGLRTVKSPLEMFRKFEETGSYDVQSDREKKRIDSMVVEEVATAVQEEPSGGVKRCCARGIA